MTVEAFTSERAQPWTRLVPEARTAVLVVHGFSSTPQSVRGWAEAFVAAGCSAAVPLLPGHGTSVEDANASTWGDWVAALEGPLADLRADHDVVVVAGISMGGALALRLAQRHPGLVDGLVLANPAVALELLRAVPAATFGRFARTWPAIAGDLKDPAAREVAYDRTPLRALMSQTRGWREVRRDLGLVHQPVLLLRTEVDHVVPALSSARVLAGISSTDVTEVVYRNSFHVLTLDHDAPAAFVESVRFARRLTAATAP
ncbi:alpha/beta hydrolase [Kineococcus rubinsiae]|uniref:alpha/beta hydrolase n=1 Tax=Kineococcus rubinsiae TaxID=2609562 RepID=UPI0014309FED|nr:alpha/beta fold hydrolase [Kineococcus rubinsiae]NIZ93618.1 alpha/beta fold hydrolase [Kineococcus rubinsiae]